MLRVMPNLDWLRVFAETAATESFTLAALRLGVTPGAVSQRIKALESFLDVPLFQRYAQGVKLTEVGRIYAQKIAPALDQLITATREVTSVGSSKTVRVTILPALAQLWLGPRLTRFHTLTGGTSVEIWADAQVVDLRTSNFDVAIRHSRPPFPGCDHRELFFDEIFPVASPELAATDRDANGLPVGAPLLLDPFWSHDFTDWLARTERSGPKDLVTQAFSLYSMMVEAALGGNGFMMGHTSLIGDLLAEGRLVALSEDRVPASKQFHLLTKSATPLSEPAQLFVDWVLAEAGGPGAE